MNITERQFEAAQRYRWLQAAYYHYDVVEATLDNPAIAGDPNISTPGSGDSVPLDYPDAVIGGAGPVYVTPETPVSERAHLSRPGVSDPGQLLTYAPATGEFLAELFQ
ncbi:hypothetical protein ABZ345_18085 [Lentzea sp. NPDC005914]|uniref:hypothetical protein n=1 Tax=Lentzea sp. NPDC005914 TaxID=3154572 RepID=UPI0033FF6324